ncbi:hypothetical protein DB313_04730 (plasmid) [Borrelia turcica IST7]|uniref:Uncharacterized protein n=1 Tax=Borrelia turcica IST7 TaxID=1104446 RepID=A0A386PPM8_9SPIR|nr:hypothetical protein [Borrelia turcica]AYE36807.1 hypothetical protein DB313_04730 [Borrelia turcica IST7]
MKKINIIFFLILAMAVMACKQDTDGETPEQKTAREQKEAEQLEKMKELVKDQVAEATKPKPETDEEKAKREEAETKAFQERVGNELTRRENEVALNALKKERDDYKTKLSTTKKTYDGTASGQKKAITIPEHVTAVKETDLDSIYSGLGYDNSTIGKLQEVITTLGITSSNQSAKAEEIKFASGALELLKSLGEDTNKVLNEYLGDAGLEKIKNDKKQIEKAKTALKAFTDSRDSLITAINNQIGTAQGNKGTLDTMKTDLEKISDNPSTDVTTSGQKGYYWTTYKKSIQAKAKEIADLVK